MKIWEILKEENIGKEVKCSTGKEYCIDKNCNYKIGIFKNGISIDLDSTEIMTLDFEFIQQPVTFEEVLNSDKKCRVEHKLTAEYSNFKEFMFLDILLSFISQYFGDEECKKIFKEAKWYLEP